MDPVVTDVTVDGRSAGGAVTGPRPRLSWKTGTDVDGWLQARAEIELDHGAVATIEGRDSVRVAWPFDPVLARSTHSVRVRVTGVDGNSSPWSEPLQIVAGFRAESWSAAMIGSPAPADHAQPTLLRRGFTLDAAPTRAILYATALGTYQVEINGGEVDDHILKPGWTAYRDRLIHETTDVTALVGVGENVIGVTLAGGWFTERYGFAGNGTSFYGEQPAVSLLLLLEFADGTTTWVETGEGWRTHRAPITSSGIYQGEDYDAREAPTGWSRAGFDDGGWDAAAVRSQPFAEPEPATAPPVRAIEQVAVVDTLTSASGAPLLDFGQNLVGRLRLTLRDVPAGTTVRLRHAEVLEGGELATGPLRHAAATDRYTSDGSAVQTWEPRFTFHGFRYAQIDGAVVDPSDVTAVVLHTDLRRTGWFDSSHALLNRFHENVVWGMRGNFLSLPTDCPQRDERLGWTGDIQVFSPTAATLFDVDGFLTSWLKDLALEQRREHGVVPFIVPNVLPSGATPAAAWGDAATVVPLVLFERYADIDVIEAQYSSMRAWVEVIRAEAGDRLLWEDRFQFGDWLDPAAPADNPFDARTDPDIVATAYLHRSALLVAEAARLLGDHETALRYEELAAGARTAFAREFLTPGGRLMSDSQTAYATAIVFELVDAPTRARLGSRLAELVRAGGYRIGTGFVGTPIICEALAVTGHADVASRLILQTANPSWLYSVTMGATTVWERWDSMLEDGTVNGGEMTSFNHYALGGVADWLHRGVAGLAPAAPGYRVLRIAPTLLDGLDHARSAQETPYGRAEAGWVRNASGVEVSATIPANTTATVTLPGTVDEFHIGAGRHSWQVPAPLPSPSTSRILESTSLADIADDEAAFLAITEAMSRADADVARTVTTRTRWTSGRMLSEVTWQLPAHVREAVDAAVEKLNIDRR